MKSKNVNQNKTLHCKPKESIKMKTEKYRKKCSNMEISKALSSGMVDILL